MKLQKLLEIDYLLILTIYLISFIGILCIYSSNISSTGSLVSNEHVKQAVWLIIGSILLIASTIYNYKKLYNFIEYVYFFMLIVLLYTRFFGRVVNGSRSWIGIGFLGIQPSEFAKLITILYLAKYLDQSRQYYVPIKRFIISCLIVAFPVLLILSQPDLGTAIVFIPILLAMVYIAGLPNKYFLFLFSLICLSGLLIILPLWQQYVAKNQYNYLSVLASPKFNTYSLIISTVVILLSIFGYFKYHKNYFFWIAYFFIIFVLSVILSFIARLLLKDYQIMRLIVFLDPNVDPTGAGWNIIQSITAIGSGGLWGKGYLLGTHSHYRYLPQQSTDFIFSIFSEEFGFIGGLLLFILYGIMVWRLIYIARHTQDTFGTYIITGICAYIWFHFFINVGMTIGIMPITGIPLIFLSYGGSSLSSAMIGIGLAINIRLRRYEH